MQLRKIFSALFVLMYVTVLMKSYLPFMSYAVNKDFIATTLCENKDKPMMHCNGKCHLAKEVKKSAKEESKNQSTTRIMQEDFTSICPDISKDIQENIPSDISEVNTLYTDNYSFQNYSNTFHPPKV